MTPNLTETQPIAIADQFQQQEVAPYRNEEPMGGDDKAAQDSEVNLYMPTLIQNIDPKAKADKK